MENSENKYSFDTAILKSLIEQGPSFVMELLRLGMNEAMKVEREQFLNAGAYQRTEARQGHANGFKPKTLNTGSGRVTFAIPQTRNCDFYPQSLQKGLRSERSLTMAMAEIRLFKERPLGSHSVLYVDAEYQRVRMNGSAVDAAVLQAVGINAEGRREVVGVFPNPESCERLVGSLLMEQHEEWMEDKAYLTDREMEKSAFCA